MGKTVNSTPFGTYSALFPVTADFFARPLHKLKAYVCVID